MGSVQGKVISKGKGADVVNRREEEEEGVHAKDEEEREEGATLLDAPQDADPDVGGLSEDWCDAYREEKRANNVAKPMIKPNEVKGW